MNLITGTAVAGRALFTEAAGWQSETAKGHAAVAEARSAEQSWSFERIYDEYKTPIYNYIYHLVGNRVGIGAGDHLTTEGQQRLVNQAQRAGAAVPPERAREAACGEGELVGG